MVGMRAAGEQCKMLKNEGAEEGALTEEGREHREMVLWGDMRGKWRETFDVPV